MTVLTRSRNWTQNANGNRYVTKHVYDPNWSEVDIRERFERQINLISTQNHSYRIDTEYWRKLSSKQPLLRLPRSKEVNRRNPPSGGTGFIYHYHPIGLIDEEFRGDAVPFGTEASGLMDIASSPRNRALIDARLNAVRGSVNLMQAFAERQQLVNMVNSTARRLSSAFRALKRRDLTQVARSLGLNQKSGRKMKPLTTKDPASQWLELQYGWLPLLGDVFGSLELIKRADQGKPIFVSIGRAKDKGERVVNGIYNWSAYNSSFSRTAYKTDEWRAKCELSFSLSNELALVAAKTGLNNPALLAWELFPYSFVVDWFLPLGDYIESLSAPMGLTFLGGSLSLKRKRKCVEVFEGYSGRRRGRVQMERSQETWNREVFGSLPVPSFPSPKSPFSTAHALNALALLRVAFK